MTVPPLEIMRENATFDLEESLKSLGRAPDKDPYLLQQIAIRYHLLGLVTLLEDANVRGFAGCLALSGQVDVKLRTLDLSANPRCLAASPGIPFTDALAAGDLETARAIARVAPSEHQDECEYEVDFLALRFQHQLLLSPDDDGPLQQLVDRWAELPDNKPGPLQAARALLARDPEAFDEALETLVAERKHEFAQRLKTGVYPMEVYATESPVFVRGLALLRLADMRKLATKPEYPQMPKIARVPLGASLPPPGAWTKGLAAVGLG